MKALRYTLISALLITSLVGCGSSAESAAGFIESGKALLEEGKPKKASLEFRNAIQIDPTQAEPFYQLALLDEKNQNWKGMYANLVTTEQLDPTHKSASIKLGQLYLLSGDFEKASEQTKKVLDVDAGNIHALTLHASIAMKQQNYGVALDDVERVLSIDQNNIEALSVKAVTLNEQGKDIEALAIIDEALRSDVDNLALIAIKLSIYEKRKDYVNIEVIYQSLIEQKPDEIWVVKSLARLLNMQDRFEEAKTVIEQFVTTHPDNNEAKLLLIALMQTRDSEATLVLLDKYIAVDETNFDFYYLKVGLQLKLNQVDDAMSSLKSIIEKDPEGNNGRKAEIVLANYAYQKGDLDEVNVRLDRVLKVAPEDEEALILKSKLGLSKGNTDIAITDLRLALRNNPESDKAMILLGQAYMSNGSQQLAEDSFRHALDVNPSNVVAAIFVAEKLLKSENVDRAERVITTALSGSPTNNTLLQVLGQIKLVKKDWAGSETVVDALRSANKIDPTAVYFEGRILQGQEKYALAIDKYKAALAIDPNMLTAMQQLTFSYLKSGDKPELMAYLEQFISEHTQNMIGYRILSNLYINDKSWLQATAIIEEGLAADVNWQYGYILLANIKNIEGKPEEAIKAYLRGIKVMPNNDALVLPLASQYEGIGKFSEAKVIYEQVLERSPDVKVVINNLASLLTDQFRSEANLRKALALTADFEKSVEPYFMDTYAWANAQLGHLEKAQGLLEIVISKSPNVAVFNYHLGSVYFEQADTIAAEKYLKQAKMLAEKQGDADLVMKVDSLLSTL